MFIYDFRIRKCSEEDSRREEQTDAEEEGCGEPELARLAARLRLLHGARDDSVQETQEKGKSLREEKFAFCLKQIAIGETTH